MRTEERTRSRTHARTTTRDNPEFVPAPSPGVDALLLEDDTSFALLESDDKILLE
jgi:hypothetical protein